MLFIELINSSTKSYNAKVSSFVKYYELSYFGLSVTSKLKNWQLLDFSEYIKELNKVIKKSGSEKLSKSEEIEWMELFDNKKLEAQKIKSKIEKTDKEIDQLVYQLYGLTEEEIEIVENSI